MDDVRYAAELTVRIAGAKGDFAAFVLDAGVPALQRYGALEDPGVRLDFSRGTLTLGIRGLGIPRAVDDLGRYI